MSTLQREIELEKIDLGAIEMMRHGRNASLTLAGNSLQTYLTAARQYNDFLRSRGLKVNEDSLKTFFAANNQWSATTHNLKRQAIMKLIQYQAGIDYSYLKIASVREMFKKHIARAKNINQAVREGKFLTESQVRRLIGAAPKRIGLMIEFAFVSGCRVSELITIRRCNVVEADLHCTIKIIGKGSKQGEVFCHRSLIDEINEVFDGAIFLFETLEHEPFDRTYVWREMRRAGKKCDIRVYPHILRHSCAMHLKKKNKPVDFIQKYLRHADVATTLRFYFHHEPDQKIVKLFEVR